LYSVIMKPNGLNMVRLALANKTYKTVTINVWLTNFIF
jgi:hypothetical protein